MKMFLKYKIVKKKVQLCPMELIQPILKIISPIESYIIFEERRLYLIFNRKCTEGLNIFQYCAKPGRIASSQLSLSSFGG